MKSLPAVDGLSALNGRSLGSDKGGSTKHFVYCNYLLFCGIGKTVTAKYICMMVCVKDDVFF